MNVSVQNLPESYNKMLYLIVQGWQALWLQLINPFGGGPIFVPWCGHRLARGHFLGRPVKISDYIAEFLTKQGISHVFVVSGGASLTLIESISSTNNVEYVCCQHEQSAAMAADAYSRISGSLGAAVATSGPGVTNMLTGIACSFYDSIPCIFIAGQVATFRQKGDLAVRQVGFQETDTVDIFKRVTKYCVEVTDSTRIRFELEKCLYMATSGRPGPVLLSLPDDLQCVDVDLNLLPRFSPKECDPAFPMEPIIKNVVELIRDASRPVFIFGNGIRLANAGKERKLRRS